MTHDLVERLREDVFHFYPVHFLMSVLETSEDADSAIANLVAADVPPEDIHTWRGEDGIRALDSEGAFHGRAARVWRRVEHITGEHAIWSDYANELTQGHVVVAVHCGPQKLVAAGVLTMHGARLMRYFTLGGIESLRPEPPRHDPPL